MCAAAARLSAHLYDIHIGSFSKWSFLEYYLLLYQSHAEPVASLKNNRSQYSVLGSGV